MPRLVHQKNGTKEAVRLGFNARVVRFCSPSSKRVIPEVTPGLMWSSPNPREPVMASPDRHST